jgi:DUF3024 family protein
MPIAQLRYDTAAGTWTVHWADRNRRWHRSDGLDPTPQLADLLKEIGEDPSPSSGDSAEPAGIAARDQLVRLPPQCRLQTPSITVAIAWSA